MTNMADVNMELVKYTEEKYTVLQPKGELDANSSTQLDDEIRSCIDSDKCHIIIDCSELSYISSAGLGIFLSHKDELDNVSGSMAFFALDERILDTFQLLGMDKIFTLSDNLPNLKQILETSVD